MFDSVGCSDRLRASECTGFIRLHAWVLLTFWDRGSLLPWSCLGWGAPPCDCLRTGALVEGGPADDGTPSQGLFLLVVQVRAWWPNLLHFLHWFKRPEYRIFCTIMSSISAPSTIDGIQMNPESLEMSFNSIVIRGPAGLLMYDSAGSISSTSPILLAVMVRALVLRNCSCKSGNWTLIAWVS
jgi:hypothetical protein